jgi:hypothetical protein
MFERRIFGTSTPSAVHTLAWCKMLTDLANSVLGDIRTGTTALDRLASAWTETTQTFLTLKTRSVHGESIPRDDERRPLFITACEGHDRPPIWPWKPSGVTKICDIDLVVRQHAQCAAHCLEYECWGWTLTNGSSIRHYGTESNRSPFKASSSSVNMSSVGLDDLNYDLYSQSLSEGAVRRIFEWLRSTGYPRNERPIYEHSWFD